MTKLAAMIFSNTDFCTYKFIDRDNVVLKRVTETAVMREIERVYNALQEHLPPLE